MTFSLDDPETLISQGACVVRGVLASAEIDAYKARLAQVSGIAESDYQHRWSLADGVSKRAEFWPLIFQEKLLKAVRSIVDADARFVQCTDLHVHRASLSWHRDSAHRKFGVGPDWSADYRVIRVAFYLHSHSFGIIPRSHIHQSELGRIEMRLWQVLTRFNGDPIPQFGIRTSESIGPTRPVWITTNPGDCILFDARLLHAAPPVTRPKFAVFLCYGPNNIHSRNHQRYYRTERRELNYEPLASELIASPQRAGLYLDDEPQSRSEPMRAGDKS